MSQPSQIPSVRRRAPVGEPSPRMPVRMDVDDDPTPPPVPMQVDDTRPPPSTQMDTSEGGRRASQRKRFDRCVKAVRKTVKARKGSSKESAAIAICTKSILHPRGRTIKRYRKGRLLTQKRR